MERTTPKMTNARVVLRAAGLGSARAGPFDLELEAGACLAISGRSGAGKTVLLRLLADLDPGSGQVWLGGRERSAIAAPLWRRQVLYVSAEPGWWHERVGQHFVSLDTGLAERLGLGAQLFDQPVARCSTGERQRLSLMRALAADPAVLLLDEPTGALDQDSVARVEAVLRERLAAGTAIVLVSHDPVQARRLGTRHLVMEGGKLTPAMPPS